MEVFREPREYCQRESKLARSLPRRKFFCVLTCEYCFSHYFAALLLIITRFKLLYTDWRGYLVALFALVWVANQYMSIYNRLRLDIKHEQVDNEANKEDVNLARVQKCKRQSGLGQVFVTRRSAADRVHTLAAFSANI